LQFTDFNFSPGLQEGIDSIGYKTPTPIQEQVIPLILEGRDIIGSAQTGTGKTAAFLLPTIEKITRDKTDDQVKALIVVPTRELAIQIDQNLEGFSYFTPISSIAIYGGSSGESFTNEKRALTEGADIVICTPGRLIAHLNMQYAKLDNLQYLILDEADRMLDMGFNEDILKIIKYLPKKRQNLMFSATMPDKIRKLAKQILNDPAEINIAVSKPSERVVQVGFVLYEEQKIPLVEHLMKAKKLESVIIFCGTKVNAKNVARKLKKLDLNVEDIHSDLDQDTRKSVLNKFKSKRVNILVATDIVSRGIDIEDIELVINFDVPSDAEDYIHRIGRTARANTTGAAFTLVNTEEQYKFQAIEKFLGEPIKKAKLPPSLGDVPEYKSNARPPRKVGRRR